MKKILIGVMIACLVAAAAIAGIVIYRYQGVQNEGEPEEKCEERQRVDPAEFEKDEIIRVILSSHNEGGEILEDISLWLYPDMLVLFRFDMRGEEKQYKADGALCYPDGREEFIEALKKIIL